jgi:hypothetical protein
MFWFPKRNKCIHKFSKWTIIKSLLNDHGMVKIVQMRVCTECNFTEINTQEK